MRSGDRIVVAILAGLLVFGLTRRRAPVPDAPPMVGRRASFVVQSSRILVTSSADTVRSLDLQLVADGATHALQLEELEAQPDGSTRGTFHVEAEAGSGDGAIVFRVDGDVLLAELSAGDPEEAAAHGWALAVELGEETRPVFVSGIGEISDSAHVSGGAAVLEDDAHPLGAASPDGPIEVRRHPHGPDHDHGHGPMDLVLSSPPLRDGKARLHIALAAEPAPLWGVLFARAGLSIANVHGVVTGLRDGGGHVFGLDESGAPALRIPVDEHGRFEVEVPSSIKKWYAAEGPSRTSSPMVFEPGTPWDLRLDVSPGGELRVRIVDADSAAPLTARLIVHGIDGTLDPSFGPDYRASGAGPIIDALRGDASTPLPAGRYRVSATKGIEYTIDAKTVDLTADRVESVELRLRHVVPTPGVLGCDLHVHARPSFDTPVTVEDRVLSLVAAGIDFAVPSEHNVVGDYGPALESLELSHEMSSVPGVEITTFNPKIGHFGLFPYPLDAKVPPFRHTNAAAIFDAARRGDPNRILQINHPRLGSIGYFDAMGFDPHAARPPARMRTDFDSIEVYNGYEMQSPERVEAVLRDYFALLNQGRRYAATGSSDSHSIQYQWAGYPRTLVSVGVSDHATLDPSRVVANLKRGHAVVTSGPIVEVDARGAHPGDELTLGSDEELTAHVRVRAVPWVDVTSVEIVVDGVMVSHVDVPSQPMKIGEESGTRDEVEARMVRFDRNLPIHGLSTTSSTSPSHPSRGQTGDTRRHWFMVMVRGTRKVDDVLPFMPVVPFAITNPIWYRTSTIGSDNIPPKTLRGEPTR